MLSAKLQYSIVLGNLTEKRAAVPVSTHVLLNEDALHRHVHHKQYLTEVKK
jgi:hypothetical protein